jgi:hypothetical protein
MSSYQCCILSFQRLVEVAQLLQAWGSFFSFLPVLIGTFAGVLLMFS